MRDACVEDTERTPAELMGAQMSDGIEQLNGNYGMADRDLRD